MNSLLALFGIAMASASAATIVAPGNLSLPPGATVVAVANDSSGNLLLTGTYPLTGQSSPQVFVAKLPPGGGTPIYLTTIASGCPSCAAGPIAVDNSGDAYISGSTSWTSFPATAGVIQSSLNGAKSAGFLVKLDTSGNVVYSTLYTGSQAVTAANAIAVNAAGEVFLTGNEPSDSVGITLRISAAADAILYSAGFGGRTIALDGQNNAYMAGLGYSVVGTSNLPTPGAFQSSASPTFCIEEGIQAFGFPCVHQFIVKLDPSGNRVFATFLTGQYSDALGGIAVDPNGNIYVAGTTGSTDYPSTSGALQSHNHALSVLPAPNGPFYLNEPLANTAYVTKLSADGSQLLYSTFLGGSTTDAATGLTVDAQGQAHAALNLQSPDFLGLPALDRRCMADRLHDLPAIATLSADGSSLVSLSIVEGVGPSAAAPLLAGSYLLASDSASGLTYLADTTTAATPDAISCITDGADFTQASPVSPGEVVTIIGNSLASDPPAVYDPTQTQLPASLGGTTVLVNGQPAPLLYTSPTQINLILPNELSGKTQAVIQVNAPNGVTATRTVPVVAATPSLFGGDTFGFPMCDGTPNNIAGALVLNADGSVNSCDNRANADGNSSVYVFLNGAGVTPGATGEIPPAPISVAIPGIGQVTSSLYVPLGVWTVLVSVPFIPPNEIETEAGVTGPGMQAIPLVVNGQKVRQYNTIYWVPSPK